MELHQFLTRHTVYLACFASAFQAETASAAYTHLTWDSDKEVWSEGEPFNSSGTPFTESDIVTFGPLGSPGSTENVIIKGEVKPSFVTVSPGEGNTYVFGTESGGKLSVSLRLTIESGTLELEVPAESRLELRMSGGATLRNTGESPVALWYQLDGDAGTTLDGDFELLLSYDWEFAGTIASGSNLTVENGAPGDGGGGLSRAEIQSGVTITALNRGRIPLMGNGTAHNAKLVAGAGGRLELQGATIGALLVEKGGSAELESAILVDGATITLTGGSAYMGIFSNSTSPAHVEAGGKATIEATSGIIYDLTLGEGLTLFSAGEASSGEQVILSNMTLADGGRLSFLAGALSSGTSCLDAGGSLGLDMGDGGTVSLVLEGAETLQSHSQYQLISHAGDALTAEIFTLEGTEGLRRQYILDVQDGTLVLSVSDTLLYWGSGANGTWSTETGNKPWQLNTPAGEDTYFCTGEQVRFGTQTGEECAVVNIDAAGVTSGAITVEGSTDYIFTGGSINSESGLTVNLDTGHTLELNLADGSGGNHTLTLKRALSLGGGSTLKLTFNLSADMQSKSLIQADSLTCATGSLLSVNIAGAEASLNLLDRRSYTFILLEAGEEPNGACTTLSVPESLNQYFDGGLRLEKQGTQLVLTGKTVSAGIPDYYSRVALSHNGRAGASILDAFYAKSAPQESAPGSDAGAVLLHIDRLIQNGQCGTADGVMAAVSGASATTLGMALAADAQQHMGNIRNRLATMKVDTIGAPDADPVTGPVPAKSKFLSAWVNAEGSYQTMEQSGSAPGYSMSSWGGTLGIEGTVLQNLRCGLALTALYGDLDADARDAASGDLDTCYISAFGQYRQSAWTHTLVASLGLSDICFDRTVSHSMGSYRTSGDTNGVSLGLLYELSYDIALNGASTTILQPLVNISYLHTTVDGYTETGSDAALSYGDQSMDSVSLGLGGRIQSLTGESVFNRSALMEGRVLAKFNGGDRRSRASVGFANGIGLAGVESAEIGVFGVEVGAGLTVPLGSDAGSLFVDASYELYSEYSNLNASVGYRLSF